MDKNYPHFTKFLVQIETSMILDNIKIELRMEQPCYNADGAPKDGSIFGTVMNEAICLSAFYMASKLNENNVREEALALLVHEISHFFGTTEEEAVEIQQRALWTFNKIDFLDARIEMKDLVAGGAGSDGQMLNFYFNLFSSRLEIAKKYNWMWEDAKKHLLSFRDRLRYGKDKILFTDHITIDMVTAQFARIYVVEDYMCANNPNSDMTTRLRCAANLRQAFGFEKQVTAAQLLTRRDPEHKGDYPEAFNKVTFRKIVTDLDAQSELKALSNFIEQLRIEILKMAERGQFFIYHN
jgi:hypothetical protein